MKLLALAAPAALILTACAGANAPASPSARAELQCSYFAREEGLRLVEVAGIDADGDNYRVRMRLEDGLGRKLNATCVYATQGNNATWAQALPPGFRRI